MSILGTPAGMSFTDWTSKTIGGSILDVNNGDNGEGLDWINDKWKNQVYQENKELKKELSDGPNWEIYFGIGAIVFLIGSILGK